MENTITAAKGRIHIEGILLAVYFALIPLENVLVVQQGQSVAKYLGLGIMAYIFLFHHTFFLKDYFFLILFSLFSISSILWTIDAQNDYLLILINLLICNLFFAQFVPNSKELDLIYLSILLSGIILARLMLSGGNYTSINDISGGRMTLTIQESQIDNNNLAISYSISALLSLYLFFQSKKLLLKLLLLSALLFLTASVLYTGSRGGFLAEVSGVCIYLFVTHKNTSLKSFILISVFVFILYIFIDLILTEGLGDRFRFESVVETGGTGRADIWKDALSSFVHENVLHQLFGFGFGTFGAFHFYNWGSYKASHNDFIGMLMEVGLIGLTLYIVVWIHMLKKVFADRNWIGLSLLMIMFVGSFSMELIIKKMLWMVWYLVLIIPHKDIGSSPDTTTTLD